MKVLTRPLAAILILTLLVSLLAACELTRVKPQETKTPPTPTRTPAPMPTPTPEPKNETLTVACTELEGKFSPFNAESEGDLKIVSMTQLHLLTIDRSGAVVMGAIDGETLPYNGADYLYKGPADIEVEKNWDGTTTLSIRLRDDLRFSDGRPVDIDDLIFSYYVFLDPSYVGPNKLSSSHIVGLRDYQTATPGELFNKYAAEFDLVYNGGEYGEDERAAEVKEAIRQAWIDSVQYIVDYCVNNYMSFADSFTGYTPDEIRENEGLQVMFGMYMWNFADFDENRQLVGAFTGRSWDLQSSFPTVEDFYEECHSAYSGDPAAYWTVEIGSGTDVVNAARNSLAARWAAQDTSYTGPVRNISGLVRVDDYTLELTVSDFASSDIYTLCGLDIAPLHYYGDESLYDYENGSYGFPFGDVSAVLAKEEPMGAGPYCFEGFDGDTVNFVANPYYWKGEPVTKTLRFVSADEEDKLGSLIAGESDIAFVSGDKSVFRQVSAANDSGGLEGDALTALPVDFRGYGYIGLNADTVNVGGNPGSTASENLRRAFLTLFSAYRDEAVQSYWGEAAYVVDYPICGVSWAAPKKGDEGYRVAYASDAQGNEIWNSETSAEERRDKALSAAVSFFKAAGYVWDEEQAKFTEAPEGAKLSYEAMLQGYGAGDHPCYRILTDAAAALSGIGITLTISDVEDSRALLSRMNAGTLEIWAGAWTSVADPDMYWTWSSDCIPGRGGSGTNYFAVADKRLDELLTDARRSLDLSYRKTVYNSCFDIIIKWACILPVYQRQDLLTANTARVDTDTLPKDTTPFWPWLREIEKIALR